MNTDRTNEVAPGYPSANTLDELDVAGWEPAAVFAPTEPVNLDRLESTDE